MTSGLTYDPSQFFSEYWIISRGGKRLSSEDLGKNAVKIVELKEMAEGILQALTLSTSIKHQNGKICSLFSQAEIVKENHLKIFWMCEWSLCEAVEISLSEWITQKTLLMAKCEDVLKRMMQLRKEKHEKRLLSYENALAMYTNSLNGVDLRKVQYVALQVNDRVLRQWAELKSYKTSLGLFRFCEDKIAANENFIMQRLEVLNSLLEDHLFFFISAGFKW